jgi:hypothetical protein
VRRWAGLLSLLAATGCSGLDEDEGGVVAIEVEVPAILMLEVGEQQQVVARAFDADGGLVDVAIGWQASTAAVTVDGEGVVTGAEPGEANVQATVGSLASEPIEFEVIAPADTLAIVGDSVVTIPVGANPPVTAALQVRLENLTFPEPLSGRPVIFEITSPVPGATPTVQLAGGVQSDTVPTSTEAVASVAISAVVGQVPPDTAIVQIRAERTRGAPVPGSGQRFIVLFQ